MRRVRGRDQARNRFKLQLGARALSVYDGRSRLGSITVNEAGEVQAFDSSGTRLGAFPDLKNALTAFPISETEGACQA
jgi:hypothetical protein